jgi:hypothetical protein
MTAIGHFSVLSETKFNPSIVTFFMTLKGQPLTSKDFIALWKDRGMPAQHPRFHSVTDTHAVGYFQQHQHAAAENEESLDAYLDTHITETLAPCTSQYRADLRARIQSLQTLQWPLTESLWHAYVGTSSSPSATATATCEYPNQDTPTESIVLFRGHHALADGASMGAALLDLCDEAAAQKQQIRLVLAKRRPKGFWARMYRTMQRLLWLLTGSVQSVTHQLHLYVRQWWDPDPWAVLKHTAAAAAGKGNQDAAADRSISWSAAAPVDQAKWIATTLGGSKTTINDVFCSCVTAALAKQLEWHRNYRASTSNSILDGNTLSILPRQEHMHVAVPVHLKGGIILPGESVSNQLGAFCVRLPGEVTVESTSASNAATRRLQAVHQELYRVKRTPAAYFSHWSARALTQCMHLLPASWAPVLFAKASAGAVAVVTNVRGAPTTVHMASREVQGIYGFVPLPPGIPVGVVVSSYAGNMSLTVTAEPWAVPDADRFMSWILEEYLVLLQEAKNKSKKSQV